MTDDERIELVSEARVFALAAPVILPIIEKKKKDALARLLQAHKMGRGDTATIVAELCAFSDIESDIKQKEIMYRTLEEKQNAKPRNRHE